MGNEFFHWKSLFALDVLAENDSFPVSFRLSVKMPDSTHGVSTHGASSRRNLDNFNKLSKELDTQSLRTSTRYPSEKTTTATDGAVNAAMTYLNASISAKNRDSDKKHLVTDKKKAEQQKAMEVSGRIMDLV